MKIRAPAKINLNLRVLGKRPDGYHLLDTVMLPVSLYDEIEIRRIRSEGNTNSHDEGLIKVSCDHPLVPGGEKNIVYRAARLIIQRAKSEPSVRIHIRKRIPVGAGLGGGSTDAAATLIGLNRMLRLRFSQTTLEKMALSLGADVPFFIRARPARARGIGERLYPLRRVPRFWLVIVYPGFPVSTAWAFRKLPSTLTKAPVNTSIPSSLKSFDRLANLLVNDLEIVTLKRYPKIRLLKERLLHQGAAGGLMSGSGSSVFGIFGSRRQAAKAWRRLRQEEGADAFLVHVLS
ncbi:MAG TPA: 4-(cytidine 5'-diphospho)-2-C-methyl-D-erythritol kinase [Candidatus Binatia bacterium]|nr:4-(cytidine 5'-diphospho)-2-C-methyl-D-erythritol kinase [Candidatus Binatia bacterium]